MINPKFIQGVDITLTSDEIIDPITEKEREAMAPLLKKIADAIDKDIAEYVNNTSNP